MFAILRDRAAPLRRDRRSPYNSRVTASPAKHLPRARHQWLYALPCAHLPLWVRCNGEIYRHVRTFKHDFFAATGVYDGPQGVCVLKLGRVNPLFGVPLRWIGRFLRRQEERAYELIGDQPGVPRFIGRVGDTGFLHAFVPGRPLEKGDAVGGAFFDELQKLIASIHARGMAYVDLNKPQNILLGDDGRPYLIDFQISLIVGPPGMLRPWRWPLRWLLARFQDADRYHSLKHKRRLRPDLLTDAERQVVERLSIWIRLHRLVARPLTNLRRRVLRRLSKSETVEVAGSSAK